MMVVSYANFTIEFSPCRGLQLWVYSVNRRGLSTQPWGALVLNIRVEEERLPIGTDRGLFVRKSSIQLQRVVLMPRVFSFPVSFMGEIVLKAELKSTNSILT